MINKSPIGERVTVPAYNAAVSGGAVILVGSILGVAVATIASGDDLVLDTKGAFDTMPKATGETWAFGDALYWDATNNRFTKTATNNKLAGNAMAAAATGDTAGSVRIGYPVIA